MKKFLGTRDILIDDENATPLAGMVDDPSAVVDADGNKYLLAGTLLTASKDFTVDDGDHAVVLNPTTDATVAQGVLRHDYNIINGAVPASVIVSGTINTHRMDDTTKKLYTDDLKKALKVALPKVTVIGRD
ncbi:hypothetical protein [Levilactobacillus spicheri]|uniref:Head decoration protein n=1 Tax=Levilactobacillus spicheri TaxID=216463 RepID=A0A0F3RVG4_9LACO|nr:hypothetical protein [Levilactobacillus spicheri]KJW12860.1 hypothetical protein VC81_06325 [Levilactobacillus spicheri]KJW13594.1 hypothetical protein VC81_03790 [Levilactobacillus spicheri]